MDSEDNILCCGCLSSGRKMIQLVEHWKKKSFLQIISEIPISRDNRPISLCWECDAQLDRFTKFKKTVKTSYYLFNDYVKQKTNLSKLQPKPRLTTHKLYNFNLHDNKPQQIKTTEHNKQPNAPEILVTEVCIDALADTNLDDEKKIKNKKYNFNLHDNKPQQIKTTEHNKQQNSPEILMTEVCMDIFPDTNSDDEKKNKQYNFNLHDNEPQQTFQIKTENNEQPDSPEIHIPEVCMDVFTDTNSDDEKQIKKRPKKKCLNKKIKKKKRKEVKLFEEIKLSRKDLEKERRLAMLKEDYVNAMFRCECCILSFPNAEDLKDHITMKHELNSQNFKCYICECSFASEGSYKYHIKKHLRRYECGACAERCNSERLVIKHYEMVHSDGPSKEIGVQNHHENGGTTDNASATKDNNTKRSSATFSCGFCVKSFKCKASLRQHVETHRTETGQNEKPYCELCRLSFRSTTNLQKHVKTSSKHQIQLKLRKLLSESLPEDSTNSEKHQQNIDNLDEMFS